MTREVNWSKAAVWQLATGWAGYRLCLLPALVFCLFCACGEVAESPNAPAEVSVDVTSLDGRLQVALPQRLIVHRHKTSIQATEADGTLRYFIGHYADTKLVRKIGASKSIVTKHEWTVEAEKHYAQASELRLRRKRPGGDVQEKRTIWFVPAGDGVVVCDGIAVAQKEDLLQEPFKKLCTGIHMRGGSTQAPSATSTPEKVSSD